MKEGWEIKTIGEVCNVINGGTPKTGVNEYWDGPHQWITPAEMGKLSSPYVNQSERNITAAGLRNSSAQMLPPYSVILSSRAPIGHLVINTTPMATNQGCKGLIPKANLDYKFLYYYLIFSVDLLNELGTGATFRELSGAKLKEVHIPFPPIKDQQRIVSILDKAFDGLATAKVNAERNLKNAWAIFESELNAIFCRRDNHEEKKLADICRFSSGGTPSKAKDSYWVGTIPWVSGRDMKGTRLSDATLHISQLAVDESATRIAPAGSLLILVRGMGLAHGAQIGEIVVPCAFNQDIKALHPTEGIVPRYLLFALKNRLNASEKILSNAAHGTLKIDTDGLQNVRVPVPDTNKQNEIVSRIDALTEQTTRLASIYQRKLSEIDALKKSLLNHAFTGQL